MALHKLTRDVATRKAAIKFPVVLDTERLKAIRLRLGLSQEDAANLAGLAGRQHWHEIESGRKTNLTIDTLDKIARALGVQAKDLLK